MLLWIKVFAKWLHAWDFFQGAVYWLSGTCTEKLIFLSLFFSATLSGLNHAANWNGFIKDDKVGKNTKQQPESQM